MNLSFEEITLSGQAANAAVAGAAAFGVLYCFLGYKTLRFIIGLTGFLLAAPVAAAFAAWIGQGATAAMVIAAILGGIAGALALTFLYKTGVFCIGFLGAAVTAHVFLNERPESWAPWAVLGIALAGGTVALVLERPVVTLATAVLDSAMVVCGIGSFIIGPTVIDTALHPSFASPEDWVIPACWATLAAAGALAQFAIHRRPREVVKVYRKPEE